MVEFWQNYLSKRLDQQHIKVDLLVIVDAANGKKSNKVDRKISKNVKKNKTYYENNDANSAMREFLVGSHGGPSEGSLSGQVENYNLSKETYKNESIDHYNIDNASRERVEKAIIDVLRDLKDGENKTISKQEIKRFSDEKDIYRNCKFSIFIHHFFVCNQYVRHIRN